MKKIFAVILSISLIMGLAACAGKVEVPSKKDVQKEVEKKYDMDFDLDSKDIAEDGSEAEWVFISEDGTLEVTVTWSADDPDEFDFDDKKLDVTGPEPTETGPLPTDVVQYDGPMVGVSMPTKDLQRWNQDGDYIKSELEALGYEVDLQYAANDVATQVAQIENMINSGCDVLIIAAIESSSLGDALDMADEAGVAVIAYDRLIYESNDVDYYVTFKPTGSFDVWDTAWVNVDLAAGVETLKMVSTTFDGGPNIDAFGFSIDGVCRVSEGCEEQDTSKTAIAMASTQVAFAQLNGNVLKINGSNARIDVFDMRGRLMARKIAGGEVDLSNLVKANGLYRVMVRQGSAKYATTWAKVR